MVAHLLCRLNLVFWISNFPPDIKYASLSDGSNVSALRNRDIEFGGMFCYYLVDNSIHVFASAAGIAVDWIKDKLYWVDRKNNAIYVYNLNTKETNKILDLPTYSSPNNLRIFPRSNQSR